MDRRDVEALQTIRGGAKKIWPGCYRGKVESIDDPDRLGRARVRVWAVHSDDTVVPDSALPWAEVSEQGGGGYDFGSFDPPPVGSGVWVMFEAGNPDLPVITGTFRGIPQRDTINPNVFLVKSNKPEVETAWKPPDEESETPKDVFDDVYAGDPHPTRRVWKKSYKGHTIIVEDGDGKEFLKIIDRAGQIIEMDCPVDEEYSAGNAAQRGVRDAIRGDQLPHDIMRNKRASIRIRDLSGQEILLDAKDQDERVVIRGHGRSGTENRIILRSGKGKDSIEIIDSAGDSIKLDPNSKTPILLQDSAGNAIKFEKGSGGVSIKSAKIQNEETPQKKMTVKGLKESLIKGDEVKEILGNKKTKVVNDADIGIMGNGQVSIGGALKMLLTNTSPNGAETDSIDIQLISGGLAFAIKTLGDIDFGTTKGDIQLETLVGNVKLNSLAGGDANLDAFTGQVRLGSDLLPDATGPVAGGGALQEQLVKGNTLHLLLQTYLTARTAGTATITGGLAAFTAPLAAGLVVNIIPAIGNTLFTVLAGPFWIAAHAATIAGLGQYTAAEAALQSTLATMLSLKSRTQ